MLTDPEQYGGRVEIQNNRPTYLFVLAKKTASRELFAQPPQQSDYATRWKLPPTGDVSPPKVIRRRLHDILPVSLKEKLRPTRPTSQFVTAILATSVWMSAHFCAASSEPEPPFRHDRPTLGQTQARDLRIHRSSV